MKPFWVYFQLLKGKKVNNVGGVSIVDQDSSSVEPFYHEYDDHRVVIWLLYSFGILLQENHVCSLSFPTLQRWHHVDTINLSLLQLLMGFERASCCWTTIDHPYFSYSILWVAKISTFICVMLVVSVKTAILFLVSGIG